jgi:hypothetical protein
MRKGGQIEVFGGEIPGTAVFKFGGMICDFGGEIPCEPV